MAGFALAALGGAAPASAAVIFTFTPGAASPGAGYTIINPFNDATGIVGSDYLIKTPPADADGSPPANSIPSGTPYLSVLAGGFATITFDAPVSAFQFDWGSIDTYNTLAINSTGADPIFIPGTYFIIPAYCVRVSPGTNGLFNVSGTAGEQFTSVTFSSSSNSFEVDNLASLSAVPEPATWGMMILGFGAVGSMVRSSRRRNAQAFYA
ncbi:PEPxxWA-CTERM sorting domain-containing protein [Phenylobacterium sp.]|uniref:Npun_F0296 family exosortase-dependent surface protein n=1 Tax=Phenylobacterium sp. TaxID=1871053 RepID=UPI00286C3EDA|nr:PEPxxWA-CTERM sorting domain-containing protein [Phenylobacterium sp.]